MHSRSVSSRIGVAPARQIQHKSYLSIQCTDFGAFFFELQPEGESRKALTYTSVSDQRMSGNPRLSTCLTCNGQIVGQPPKKECRQKVPKMSKKCPKMFKYCPEGLKTQFSDMFLDKFCLFGRCFCLVTCPMLARLSTCLTLQRGKFPQTTQGWKMFKISSGIEHFK